MIGMVYEIQPEPPDEANTRWFPAGVVTFGLEHRQIDSERLAQVFADNPKELADFVAQSPEGGYHDSGVTIHVNGAADGHEYLRFDVFANEPHYHYIRPTGDHNQVVPFDVVAGGDMLAFVLSGLRERLGGMLAFAGGDKVAAGLDPTVQGPVIDEVAALASDARQKQRSVAGSN